MFAGAEHAAIERCHSSRRSESRSQISVQPAPSSMSLRWPVPSSGSVSVSPSASTSSPRRSASTPSRSSSVAWGSACSVIVPPGCRRRAQAPRPRTRAVGTRRRRPRRRVDRRWSREPNRSSRRGRGTRAISTGTHVNRTTTLGYRISRPVVRTASVGGSTAQCNDFPILGASSKLSPIANTVTHWAVAGQLGV